MHGAALANAERHVATNRGLSRCNLGWLRWFHVALSSSERFKEISDYKEGCWSGFDSGRLQRIPFLLQDSC